MSIILGWVPISTGTARTSASISAMSYAVRCGSRAAPRRHNKHSGAHGAQDIGSFPFNGLGLKQRAAPARCFQFGEVGCARARRARSLVTSASGMARGERLETMPLHCTLMIDWASAQLSLAPSPWKAAWMESDAVCAPTTESVALLNTLLVFQIPEFAPACAVWWLWRSPRCSAA